MCTRATCAALKALESLLYGYFRRNSSENDKLTVTLYLQKSRSNGGRRNHREVGGWFQQAPGL